eukprot:TRINITY_DN2847_c0_g2_i1.p1 TRINITY_DN2847_c0_g2~~TRINITY_DN2847_c0_g2_i1.p1  ORF type:complete len:696 (+),score=133.49 TRINITY_DN2847_c0_g2_i1:124-2088(+)
MYTDGDASAARVAGNELQALLWYFNTYVEYEFKKQNQSEHKREEKDSRIAFPLMALLDYRGFRLICMSLLPISKKTLVYGSDDGGRTIYNTNHTMHMMMENLAEMLNLQEHVCGALDKTSTVVLHHATDLEGHVGKDRRFYLLDFARALPCEYPKIESDGSIDPTAHLVRLFRPEFVKTYKKKLCSDACSRFVMFDNQKKRYIEEIKEATDYLHNQLIPSFVTTLIPICLDHIHSAEVAKFSIAQLLHDNGISVRHLGRIVSHIKSAIGSVPYAEECRWLVIAEMASRALKRIYRQKLRSKMKELQVPVEQPYLQVLTSFLNLAFGNSKSSDVFWETSVQDALVFKFGSFSYFNQNETPSLKSFLFKKSIDVSLNITSSSSSSSSAAAFRKVTFDAKLFVFRRFQRMTGFKLRKGVWVNLCENPTSVFLNSQPFDQFHIKDLGDRIKHLNIVSLAEGIYMLKQAKQRSISPEAALPLCDKSLSIFEELLQHNPHNSLAIVHYAFALRFAATMEIMEQHMKLEGKDSERNTSLLVHNKYLFHVNLPHNSKLSKSLQMLQKALKLNENDKLALVHYAKTLQVLGQIDEAEHHYLRSLEVDPNYISSLKAYADFLSNEIKLKEEVHRFYERISSVIYSSPLKSFCDFLHLMNSSLET